MNSKGTSLNVNGKVTPLPDGNVTLNGTLTSEDARFDRKTGRSGLDVEQILEEMGGELGENCSKSARQTSMQEFGQAVRHPDLNSVKKARNYGRGEKRGNQSTWTCPSAPHTTRDQMPRLASRSA